MTEELRHMLVWFLIAAAMVAIVLGLYAYVFFPFTPWTLSRDPEDWARFGEYAGGTLGAMFALLAFGSVLFTIREQRRQGVLEEFQRQMASLSQRVESLLSEDPAEASPADLALIQQRAKSKSIYSLLRRVGIQAMRDPHEDYLVRARHDELRNAVVPSVRRQLDVVQLELQHLVWCLQQYVEMGGSQSLINLYTRRYQPIVCWIHVLGMTESEPMKEWFQPDRFHAA